jgi:hypothetical protein
MRTFKIGERSSFRLKNTNISGFFVKILGVGSAVNTTPVLVPYKARINAKLQQGNFNDTILDGVIANLAKGTASKLDKWAHADYMQTTVLTAAAAAVVGITEWLYLIKFPTVINLNDDDALDIEIELPSDALTDHNTSTSYIGIEEVMGVGSQFFIPKVKEYVLAALETKADFNLGDNILQAVLLASTNKTPLEDGATKIELFSDRRNEVLEGERMRYAASEHATKGIIFIAEEHDSVKVKFTMDGTLNAARDLCMVVTDFYIDGNLVAEGQARQARHVNTAKRKLYR